MTIRPKTTRRVSILLVGAALIAGTCLLVFRFLSIRHERVLTASMIAGMQAYEAADYAAARDDLNIYVAKHKDNPKVLLEFANSLAKTAAPDNSYAATAIFWMQRYVGLAPDDQGARHQLLQMEVPSRDNAEDARQLAGDLLSKDPTDLVALKALIDLNVAKSNDQDALKYADEYLDLNPTDLDIERADFMLMKQLNQPGTQMTARADALAKKYPNDPRFLLVQAMAALYSQPPGLARFNRIHDLAVAASSSAPPDVQYVRMSVRYLDGSDEYGKSEDMLEQGADSFHDPELTSELIQRLWQHYEYDEVVKRTAALDPVKADVNLVAYRALALAMLGRNADATPLGDALSKRGDAGDKSAAAWALAIQVKLGDLSHDSRTLLPVLQKAMQDDPRNAVVQDWMGIVYGQMGEQDLSLQSLRSACADAPTWSDPYVRIAQTLLRKNEADSQEALLSADMGVYTSRAAGNRTNSQAILARWEVMDAVLKKHPNAADQADLLSRLQAWQEQYPAEPQSLPIYVDLLAQAGQRDRAIAAVRAATTRPSSDATTDLLTRLAYISEQDGLGVEDQIFAVLQKGGMTPVLAQERAEQLALHGKAADGLKLMKDARAAANPQGDARAEWDIQICQYLQHTHDPSAADEWRKTGQAYPKNLTVQAAILSDPYNPALADRDFTDKTIDRLRALTGDQATQWKVCRAAWDLSAPTPDAPAALALLQEVIKVSPSEYKPRELAAVAYEKEKNLDAAVEQWRDASELDPTSAMLVMKQVKDLSDQGKFDNARTTFDRMKEMDVPYTVAVDAAQIMEAQGDLQRARDMLQRTPAPGDPAPTPDQTLRGDQTLARILRLQGQNDDAAKIYLSLDKQSAGNLQVNLDAADFFASTGHMDLASKFLDKAASLTPDATRRALTRANFDEKYAPDSAAADYADAVKASSDDPAGILAQIGYLIRQKKYAQAGDAAAMAQHNWSDNPALAVLQSTAQIMLTAKNPAPLAPLADAVSVDPVQGSPLNALQILASQDPAAPDKLQQLAQQSPPVEVVYVAAAQTLMSANRVDEGLAMAEKAHQIFPNSANSAHIASLAYAQVGRWTEALNAAQDWRVRTPENPLPADLSIASLEQHLGRAQAAADLLAPYVQAALQNPDANSDFFFTYSQALIASGQSDAAANLLTPLAQKSSAWRGIWLTAAAAQPDGDSAAAWIAQCPGIDPNSLVDMGNQAYAYFTAAGQYNYPLAYQKACDALQPFVDSSNVSAPALILYGNAASKANHVADAEKAYRKALAIEPDPPTMNNLADFLRQQRKYADAESWSRKAVAGATPDNAASFYDTLARILRQEGKIDDAIAQFQKGYQADPRNLSILCGLANTYATIGRTRDASDILQQLAAIASSSSRMTRDELTEVANAQMLVAGANSAPATRATTTGN